MGNNIERGNRFFLSATILSSLLLLNTARLWAADSIENLKSREPFAGLSNVTLKTAVKNAGDIPAVPAPTAVLSSAGALHAYFIDVGQGDAEYIELPNGKNVLIDGGPANPAGTGDPLVAQFLSQHDVVKIDYVLLTHPHSDHYTGLDYVFSHYTVHNFYDTNEENTGSSSLKTLRAKISNMGVNVSYPAEGDSLNWDPGEVQVKVLHSCSTPGSSSNGAVLNNCSIVLRITYQNTSLLYTGDMQSDVEAQLVQKYGSQLQSDVLKVGHHGSAGASSASFVNAVKPKAAYIEVGANNSYGHPTQAALSRLQAAGAAIYRTDQSGTMEYTVGGNAYTGPLSAQPAAAAYSWSQY